MLTAGYQKNNLQTIATPPLTSQLSLNPKPIKTTHYLSFFLTSVFLFPSQHYPLMRLITQPPSWRRKSTDRAGPQTTAVELDLPRHLPERFIDKSIGAKVSN